MEYKPERLPDVHIREAELRHVFQVSSMFNNNEAEPIEAVIAMLQKARAAAVGIGYTNIHLVISAENACGDPSLEWELRGARMETSHDVEARKSRDQLMAKRKAKREADERKLFETLRAKYGD